MSIYEFPKKTIKDIDLRGKTVLMRADFNVPLDEKGEITSDYRITQTLPTIEYLLKQNCKLVIVAHLGRPEGKFEKKFSLFPVYKYLKNKLGATKVSFADDCIGDKAYQVVKEVKNGEVVLLENLRFHKEEEENDAEFAKKLKQASNANYFVQDGFGIVHRAHASTEAITHFLPSVSGLLLEKEVSSLEQTMKNPRHPLVAVVGGAKISDKIGFIEELLKIADKVLIGGAMANTFLKAAGHEIGKSIWEEGQEKEIATILQKAKKDQIILPKDVGVASEIATSSQRRDCGLDQVKSDEYILDLGFETMRKFTAEVKKAATVIWNGTLGYAEIKQFAQSSEVLAKAISSEEDVTSIIGGGDTADFVLDWLSENPQAKFTHISTGGGASLELMSGQKLPGVETLLDK